MSSDNITKLISRTEGDYVQDLCDDRRLYD